MSCTILNIIICWSTLIRTDLHTKKFVYESMLFETTLITLFPVNLQTKLHISAIRYNKHAWKLFPETIVNCTLCASASYGGVSWFGGCVAYRSQRGGRKVWHAKNRLQNAHISRFSTEFFVNQDNFILHATFRNCCQIAGDSKTHLPTSKLNCMPRPGNFYNSEGRVTRTAELVNTAIRFFFCKLIDQRKHTHVFELKKKKKRRWRLYVTEVKYFYPR